MTEPKKRVRKRAKHANGIILTDTMVSSIKRRLWYGETREDVAATTKISLSTICNIGAGQRWAHIPWPDNSNGPIHAYRKEQIHDAREAIRDDVAALLRKELKRAEKATS